MTPERYHDLVKKSKNDKLLIGIGCSFTEGQGALTDEVWERYNWKIENTHAHPELEPLEVKGSWVTQVCENYSTDWTPINLGERGGGNYAAAKHLTSIYPELNLEDENKEKIVVFMLTGPERFSVPHGDWHNMWHGVVRSIWPVADAEDPLWRAYATEFYSEKQTMLSTYFTIKEVETWCKAYNAKLIIASAFDFSYNKEYTKENIKSVLGIDWDLQSELFKFRGHPSAFHMLLSDDGFDYNVQNGGYWDALNYTEAYPKGTPHVSRCCHPNLRGHGVIAKELYAELTSRGWMS